MQIIKTLTFIIVSGFITTGHLLAQAPPKNNAKLANGKKNIPAKNITILFPDFFYSHPIKQKDTTLVYECYDRKLNKIPLFDLKSIDQVDHIKYYKTFSRIPARPNSIVSAPIEFRLQYEYVQPDPGVWLRYDPVSGEITHYAINKKMIVRTEKESITNPVTHEQRSFVYKYFKTEEKNKEKGQPHTH